MCGIAGVFNYKSMAPARSEAVLAMGQVMAHRGPDGDGVFVSGPVGLAHRRLAIIDLSERGRQPMHSPDGRFAITFNGEIYNYVELRRDLLSRGFQFKTDSDTEVLLHLYAEKGKRCLDDLAGMFAFAVWDNAQQELFIARDRVGIKPLYYAETTDGLVFGSEAKALFEYPGLRPEADVAQIHTYMTFGYVPGQETTFKGVRKLLPGHCLRVTARTGVRIEQYWDVHYAPNTLRREQATAEELHALLLDATRIHLRSDVPVGVFLSGGLDSSAVVSLVAEAGVTGMKTFSVAYRESAEFDESAYARMVSDRFGTDHQVLYVEPDRFVGFIPDYVWHMDEPVTEAAALSLYFVSKELRKQVTVALSGEGADELFAGYQVYRYMLWLERYRKVPQPIRALLLDRLLSMAPHARVRRFARLAKSALEQRYLGVPLYDSAQRDALYTREFSNGGWPVSPLAEHWEATRGLDPLSRMLYVDLKGWLVDDLLIKADKMTMASSVELRVPFLDHRVIEFAATIPSSMKLRGGDVKWVLKEAMRSRLPQQIATREKIGFPTPLAAMFRGHLSGYLRDVLLSRQSRERGYFDAAETERLLIEHAEGVRDHHKTLWQLVVLEEWHRRFIDRVPGAREPVP